MNLSFSLARIPVRIHPSFFLMALLFGANRSNPARLVEWVLVVLVSVLLHELGHALMGKAFGLAPEIDLPGGGGAAAGVTSFPRGRSLTASQSVLVSLAGPLLGIVFGGTVWALRNSGVLQGPPMFEGTLDDVLWVNIGWGLVNLLPVLPLDGGNVLWTVARVASKERGEAVARTVSIVVAGGLAIFCLLRGSTFGALYAAYFVYINVTSLRARA